MDALPVDTRQEDLRQRLLALGFDDVRFAAVTKAGAGGGDSSLRDPATWIGAGMHADMQWMERSLPKRRDPELVLSGVRSVILLGVSYWSGTLRRPADPAGPVWARYSLYEDYHDTIKPGLMAAGRVLEELYGVSGADYRYYVDTGPVNDREWAARAGLGFIGKNAMLISRSHGNWLFVAAILTRVPLAPDEPVRRGGEARPSAGLLCGKCTRCLDACPTAALREPGVVDARRCISYQTIENKGLIPRELRGGIGNHIYGCDICLDVCPWNRFARDGRQTLLMARHELAGLTLRDLLQLDQERFAQVFRHTPIKRVKLAGLLRNACVVAGNSGDASLLPLLVALATTHPLALVRAHAVWAVFRLGGAKNLADARGRENDPLVRAEYAAEGGEIL